MFISPYARQRTEKAPGDDHTSFVQMRDGKYLSLLPWIATRATTLASTAGVAVLLAWMPLLLGASRDALPASQVEDAKPSDTIDAGTEPLKALAHFKVRCAECGSIESIRKVEREPEAIVLGSAGAPADENRRRAPMGVAAREITVRLQDGSSRVMIDTNPGSLRLGARVKVIDGLAGPGE